MAVSILHQIISLQKKELNNYTTTSYDRIFLNYRVVQIDGVGSVVMMSSVLHKNKDIISLLYSVTHEEKVLCFLEPFRSLQLPACKLVRLPIVI